MNEAHVARMKFALQVIATFEAEDPWSLAKLALEEVPSDKIAMTNKDPTKAEQLLKEIQEKLEELRDICSIDSTFEQTGVDDTEYAKKESNDPTT